MVETIGGKIHAFIESVKYGCVVLSCMFVNRDNALDLIKQLTVEFALEDVITSNHFKQHVIPIIPPHERTALTSHERLASASHITSNHFKQHVIPIIPPHERTALTSHERLPSWSEQNLI
uniref:Uncharacterized protein n=1 Tax=Daphnia galeata TaxID=27404 RepID=A0A8J2W224_9CRUS|nr:unnamed protein product [Daphnia galeata]